MLASQRLLIQSRLQYFLTTLILCVVTIDRSDMCIKPPFKCYNCTDRVFSMQSTRRTCGNDHRLSNWIMSFTLRAFADDDLRTFQILHQFYKDTGSSWATTCKEGWGFSGTTGFNSCSSPPHGIQCSGSAHLAQFQIHTVNLAGCS